MRNIPSNWVAPNFDCIKDASCNVLNDAHMIEWAKLEKWFHLVALQILREISFETSRLLKNSPGRINTPGGKFLRTDLNVDLSWICRKKKTFQHLYIILIELSFDLNCEKKFHLAMNKRLINEKTRLESLHIFFLLACTHLHIICHHILDFHNSYKKLVLWAIFQSLRNNYKPKNHSLC